MLNWEVKCGNAMRLLEIVSALGGYHFSEWDADAIHYGLRGTAATSGNWYEYGLFGESTIHLRLASASNARVAVQATADEQTEAALSRIIETSDEEAVEKVRRAFQSSPRPDHFTNYTHCPECKEHDDLLRSRTWETLTHKDVRYSWSPLDFLGPDAFRYWIPAFLRLCLIQDEDGFLDQFLRILAAPESPQFSLLTSEEREAVVQFLRHLVWWRPDLVAGRDAFEEVLRAWQAWEET